MLDFIKSKKVWMAILSALGVSGAGLENQPWYVVAAIAFVSAAYLVAQGLADHGKEAAAITAASNVQIAPAAPVAPPAAPKTPDAAPLAGMLLVFLAATLGLAALESTGCSAAQMQQAGHDIRSTTDLGVELCKLSPEMQAQAQVKGVSIADVCTGIEAIAPFVDSILAAEAKSEQAVRARRERPQACSPVSEGGAP